MFQILLALADGPRHGYAVMQEIDRRSGGDFTLGPGTLYRSIQRLVRAGLISEVSGEGEGNRRRAYRLTAEGRRAAAGEARRLEGFVRWAEAANLIGRRGGIS
jgi:DNA-binding PadR family transcriptional regulator